ncbi:hypothetical protein AVEN_100853-1 [Araneus ventricosus]|uniref:DDE-1 domain-containing protein n=1 Tax=Araneus ventricosus TaxID=182803 RepID=A0A4Y2AVT7_ARAVE|nr:hypothetical protein AVEN_100853-1 [Araneus ventricosus]
MIAQAWQLVKIATIRKSFHKIIVQKRRENESQQTENPPTDGELFEIINGIEGCEEVLKEDIFEWLDVENQHPSFQILNDEEMIQAVDPLSDINDADNEDQDFEDLRTISHTEGVQALTTVLKYLEQRSNVTPIDLLLKNWRDQAATDRNSGLLQRKVIKIKNLLTISSPFCKTGHRVSEDRHCTPCQMDIIKVPFVQRTRSSTCYAAHCWLVSLWADL